MDKKSLMEFGLRALRENVIKKINDRAGHALAGLLGMKVMNFRQPGGGSRIRRTKIPNVSVLPKDRIRNIR